MLTIPRLMRRRRLLTSVGTILLLAAGLAGAAVKSTGASGASSAFVINMPVGPATLDPAEECGFTDITITEAVYTRLTQYGSKPGPNGTTQVDPGHMVPYLAKSWNITNGGKVYTFHLRSGVKFPSGKPVDARYGSRPRAMIGSVGSDGNCS